jgi:histone deacetylase 6
MFIDDPRVLFFSVHRFDHGRFYPNSPDAHPKVVGEGPGAGFNVNIGWNGHGYTTLHYVTLIFFDNKYVLPIDCASEFS